MASRFTPTPDALKAVEGAVIDLVQTSAWGGFSFVNLPIYMPSGSAATVRISGDGTHFRIDDAGFAYREIEAVGAERSFSKTAAKIAASSDLMSDKKTIFVESDINNLSRAICDVAMASFKVADGIFERIASEDVSEIEEHLKERLARIFGEAQVVENEEIAGASSKKWGLSAVVHINRTLIAFQAVSTHANSVNRASTAFHDLRELSNPPMRIAVVKDRDAMGVSLNILAQAGKIIQSDQSDEIYQRAVA